MIPPHNLFLSLSLPFPFFPSRPVSVYMSQLVGGLEEPRTPFLLNRLEQSQRAMLKGRSRVRPITGLGTRKADVLIDAQSLWPLGLAHKTVTIATSYSVFHCNKLSPCLMFNPVRICYRNLLWRAKVHILWVRICFFLLLVFSNNPSGCFLFCF